ncbi:UDP-N-acetylmuramoyl-tripeptide--D-alanyl-D-alanine ligase [Schleiferiaceae bacterium]|jgi:UDP-N-acetylmuramoyl-tripeptide--D-alanyl-D-alanine ligase|nr:UDP-N-acetylmuramoyl-tripeptide--D-alanyl-D-alanine ligase [Schleiferiaceae bacterium]MDA9151131.1 UDP-N-acetylmuramoyl-tripeptide--D-alanyl-D-alanine ligase [Schleiferiaceae bacterium]MDC3353701.1 UDP-N-acetylmuramoyl-tripeptide--D-alanyl-D-alanine ligase [Schleiferiaceae bacterium]
MERLYACFDEHVGICSDSRSLESGQIFFALKGERFDGHSFAVQALAEGATAVVVEDLPSGLDVSDPRVFHVPSVLQALQDLARYHRRQWGKPIVAMTGSNGKTTVKELFAAVLSQKFNLHATKGNFNNHLGVPFTLLQLRTTHELAVVEMGANHQGEIDLLSRIAEPSLGYITNFGRAHLEGFGGVEGVIKGKTELYRYLRASQGEILCNPEDSLQVAHAGPGALVFEPKLSTWMEDDGFVHISDGTHSVKSHLSGSFQGNNLKAAWTLGLHYGLNPEAICAGISSYIPSNNRGELRKTAKNTLFLDAYNANPSSMELSFLYAKGSHPELPHVYIAGDLFELGSYSALEHQRMVDLFVHHQATHVWLIGEAFSACRFPDHYRSFSKTSEALIAMQEAQVRDSFVWIKGSRGMALESLLPAL